MNIRRMTDEERKAKQPGGIAKCRWCWESPTRICRDCDAPMCRHCAAEGPRCCATPPTKERTEP